MTSKLKQLNRSDNFHLSAAERWMELGDFVSACSELEEITAEARANPVVLSMRFSIYAKAKKWDLAAGVAEALTNMLPDKPESWAI